MKKFAWIVGVAAVLVGAEAKAEVVEDNFNPQTTFRPNEFPWTSNPVSVGPLSVSLTASAYHEVDIEMMGDAAYDFDAQQLVFTGEADGGVMQNALGVEVGVIVSVTGIGDFDVGVYNIEEEANGTFSPYLLPGDVERPFGVSEAIGPNDLVDTNFNIGNVPITLDIDWTLNVPMIEYRSNEITLSDGDDSVMGNQVGVYAYEDEHLDLILPNALPGETSEVYGTLHGSFDAEVSVVFTINATAVVLDTEIAINQDVILDFPVNDNEPVEFPVEVMRFDVPELADGTSSGGDIGSSSGDGADGSSSGDPDDSDSDSDGTTTGEPSTTSGADGSSGGVPVDVIDPGESGCGCTSGQDDQQGPLWAVSLFVLALVRRRR